MSVTAGAEGLGYMGQYLGDSHSGGSCDRGSEDREEGAEHRTS